MFYTIGRLVRKSLPRISSGPVDILTYTEIGLHCFRKMKCKKWKTSCPSLSVNFNFTTTGNNVAISVIGQFAVVDKTTDNAARINSSRKGHALKNSWFSVVCIVTGWSSWFDNILKLMHDCWIISPCQHLKKSLENSVENMQRDVRVKGVNC